VLFLDEAEALSLEHLLPPPQAREASARLVATLCERLDGVADTARVLVVASTSRTDAVDSALVAPGRLDHLVEVPLPDADEQRDILQLLTARTEGDAGRKLFDIIDYRKLLPLMGGMSGADLTEIIRRALETKVRQVAEGGTATNVVTEDLLDAVDQGIDLFDSVLPSRVARTGQVWVPGGRLNLRNAAFLDDPAPIEDGCPCLACRRFSRAYLAHLFRARELLAYRLATAHNLTFTLDFMARIRAATAGGRLPEAMAGLRERAGRVAGEDATMASKAAGEPA